MTEAELYAEVMRRVNPDFTKSWADIFHACRPKSADFALAKLARAAQRGSKRLIEGDIREAFNALDWDVDAFLKDYPYTQRGLIQAALQAATHIIEH